MEDAAEDLDAALAEIIDPNDFFPDEDEDEESERRRSERRLPPRDGSTSKAPCGFSSLEGCLL